MDYIPVWKGEEDTSTVKVSLTVCSGRAFAPKLRAANPRAPREGPHR
jgi:hypothetical protein